MRKAFETYIASLLSSLTTMVALTLLDVWVVYFLLKKNGLDFNLLLVWWFPFGIMELIFPLCLILTFENKIPLTCYLFFLLGGEDTLYYLFTARHIPEVYHGIHFLGFIYSPTREVVLTTLSLGLLLCLVVCYAEYAKTKEA